VPLLAEITRFPGFRPGTACGSGFAENSVASSAESAENERLLAASSGTQSRHLPFEETTYHVFAVFQEVILDA
jgi:hypothetical protein